LIEHGTEGEKLYGSIGVAKKDDVWIVTEENWSNTPPEI